MAAKPDQARLPAYLSYWGKAQPASEQGPDWHPLAYHGLDVAAVGAALLKSRPQLLAALARASGLPQDLARRWLLFALALHDIGKFACCFQTKVERLFRHQAHWSAERPLAVDPGHGRLGIALWEGGCDRAGSQDFASLFGPPGIGSFGIFRKFSAWFSAAAGHHGRPVEKDGLIGCICPTALADARAYIEDCATLFDPRIPEDLPKLKEAAIKRSSWLAAGLTILCDWVGSNQGWFPYTKNEYDLAGYWEIATGRARDALAKAGMSAPRIAARFTLADALNKQEPAPTPLQRWAAEEAPVDGQSLLVIEDLTGAGKTEAGLIIAHRLMASGAAEGLYWALPTMATADALYKRMSAGYQRLFADARDASLVLAHSASAFNDIFAKSIFEPCAAASPRYNGSGETRGEQDANVTASAACARWLADDRRKTFLADVGVGTIDQALLGVLPSKHQALRLAALSRRTLIVDEAHSYDPYMTKLLERLLEFQGALGGSVIVMSATLTKEARDRFASAFAMGAGWEKFTIKETGFPLATVISAARPPLERTLAPGRGTRRDLAVRRLDGEAEAVEVLAEAAAKGQAAVWIRNTVQDALDAYEKVQALLPDAQVDLFHARFALCDRLDIERRVLDSFGKDSEGPQRQRVLIATQVVEQSLDCDWDVMISDLAPVDLLIQRAGRLHRHDHRPPRPAPVLHIVSPDPTADSGAKWYEAAFPRAAYVYPDHGQLWLTMRALLDAGGLKLASGSPRDLIERVFARDSDEIPERLADASVKAMSKSMADRAIAQMNGLRLEGGYVHQAGAWESDARTPTRLGEDTRVLRLAKWDGSTLTPWKPDGDPRRAWRLSEVSVRAGRVSSVSYSHDAALEKAVAREIAAWPERYDQPLLVALVEDGGAWTARARDAKDYAVILRYCPTLGLMYTE